MKNRLICDICGKKADLILEYEAEGQDNYLITRCSKCFTDTKSFTPQRCEVYSRVVGYLRPVSQWNTGKQKEYKDRVEYEKV